MEQRPMPKDAQPGGVLGEDPLDSIDVINLQGEALTKQR
jgi:hypothetical protein